MSDALAMWPDHSGPAGEPGAVRVLGAGCCPDCGVVAEYFQGGEWQRLGHFTTEGEARAALQKRSEAR